MAKIILLVGEHRNEVIGAKRAHEIKPLLEAKGHEVLITSFRGNRDVYSFGVKLSKVEKQKDAFKLISKFLSQGEEEGSRENLRKYAKENPDSHVFSFHATPQWGPKIGDPPILEGISTLKMLKEYGFVQQAEAAREWRHRPMHIEYDHVDGGEGKKVIGIVENIATYGRKINPKQQFDPIERYERCTNFIREWIEEKKKSGVKRNVRNAQWLLEDFSDYARLFATIDPQSQFMKKEHSQVLAEKIHEMITDAEKNND